MRIKGSIALVTVIVVSGILLATGVVIVLANADLALSAEGFLAQVHIDTTERTCLEECLYRVKLDPDFRGMVNFSNESGACTADITTDPIDPNIIEVDVTVAADEFARNSTIRVDISSEPYEIVD